MGSVRHKLLRRRLRRQRFIRSDGIGGNVLAWTRIRQRAQTMLTVLTQTPAFVLGKWNEDWPSGC
jgi:hypothetical protein